MASKVEINIEAYDKASPAIKQVAKATDDVNAATKETENATTRFSSVSLQAWMQIADRVIDTAKEIYKLARAGAELELVETRFDRLADSIGTTSEVLLTDLRDATQGLYSDAELMASASDLMALGLANSHDEAVRLAAVSAGLNMNMNQLVLTLTNMTTMRFDALGVRVDGFKDKVKALEAAGLSADAAFKEAFLQQAEEQLQRVGHAADTSLGSFMRLESQMKNNSDRAKELTAQALAPLIKSIADSYQMTNDYSTALRNLDPELANIYDKHKVLTPEMRNLIAASERGAAMQNLYAGATRDAALAIGEASQAASTFYPNTISLAQKLFDSQKDYNQKLEEAKEKYGETSEEVSKLQTKHAEAMAQMQFDLLMTTLKADGLTQAEYEIGIAAGVSMGIFTEETADGAIAMQRLTDMVATGKITVDEYGDILQATMKDGIITTNELNAAIRNLPTERQIAIRINTYGNLGAVGDLIPAGARATGGAVMGGKMYEVNERGAPELLGMNGKQYLMMPPNNSGMVSPMQMGGGSGSGGGSTVIINVNSAVSVMDEEKARNTLVPLIEEGLRTLESRGQIRSVVV